MYAMCQTYVRMYGTYSILFKTGQSDLQHINGGADVFDPGHGYGIRSTLSLDLTATRDHQLPQ